MAYSLQEKVAGGLPRKVVREIQRGVAQLAVTSVCDGKLRHATLDLAHVNNTIHISKAYEIADGVEAILGHAGKIAASTVDRLGTRCDLAGVAEDRFDAIGNFTSPPWPTRCKKRWRVGFPAKSCARSSVAWRSLPSHRSVTASCATPRWISRT